MRGAKSHTSNFEGAIAPGISDAIDQGMGNKIMHNFVKLLISLVVTVLVTSCEWETVSGDFENFKIQDNQSSILETLKLSTEIKEVHIGLKAPECASGSDLDHLESIFSGEAVIVRSEYLYHHIIFDKGLVAKVFSNTSEQKSLGVEVGERIDQVRRKVENFLTNNTGSSVEAALSKHFVKLSNLDIEGENFLMKATYWYYHIPDSYSYAELFFEKNVLVRAVYNWSPFELP